MSTLPLNNASHTVDGLLIQKIEPIGLVVSASEHNYMADKWAASRIACADELGNMLHRFDTVVDTLQTVLIISGLSASLAVSRCAEMKSKANPSRELLKKLNEAIDNDKTVPNDTN